MNNSEIAMVMDITGTAEEQIVPHNDGYWSRAYVVNGGEYVVKFPKYDDVSYENEAKFLNLIRKATLSVNTQKVKWLADDKRCIALVGVKGTPLSKTDKLSVEQKRNIAAQLADFLKQIHQLKTDFGGQSLEEEISEYIKAYDECAWFYKKYFSGKELKILDRLMYTRLPSIRRGLGEKIVFAHADIWEPNILLDDNEKVGIIDCGNAGHFDEAIDFAVEDETLRGFILDTYGANETLRKKAQVKYDMSTITCPKYGVPLWGEPFIVNKWVPLIRKVIIKY